MVLDIIEWYRQEFEINVNDETKFYVTAFSIIWTQYENILYDRHFGPRKYSEEKNRLEKVFEKKSEIKEQFNEILVNVKLYCMKKYKTISNIYTNFLFDNDLNENPELTLTKFEEIFNSTELRREIHLVISLLGRVRNNLFHGEKSIYDLNNQIELFKNLEKFMILSIESYRYQ